MVKKKKGNKDEEEERSSGIGLFGGILLGVGALIAGIVGKTLYDEVFKEEEEDTKTKEIEEDIEMKKVESIYQEQKSTIVSDSTLDSFICPITQEMMNDPVITPDGISYEREAITNWININNTDPLTKKPLEKKALIPNYALKNAISDYCLTQSQVSKSK